MEKFVVEGGNVLKGEIEVGSSKNSVLPLLSACLLCDGDVTLKGVSPILDALNMLALLKEMKCEHYFNCGNLTINTDGAMPKTIDGEMAKSIRSSIFLLGSMLSRFKEVKMSYPGGCDIGKRPIDLHIEALEKMGATFTFDDEYLYCKASKLKGANITLKFESVGATENIMLAGVKADGVTIIENPAKEPEIVDLQDFLVSMGAKIKGAGPRRIEIEGVKRLKGVTFSPIPDRIEAGTFLVAGAILGEKLEICKCKVQHLYSLIDKLVKSTCKIGVFSDKIIINRGKNPRGMGIIETRPYPFFPTDMQSQLLAISTVCDGNTVFKENIFENRFNQIEYLKEMGADIVTVGNIASVQGVKYLTGKKVKANDLRGGVSLVLAGLIARGETTIEDARHILRGYYKLEEKLRGVGSKISFIKE